MRAAANVGGGWRFGDFIIKYAVYTRTGRATTGL